MPLQPHLYNLAAKVCLLMRCTNRLQALVLRSVLFARPAFRKVSYEGYYGFWKVLQRPPIRQTGPPPFNRVDTSVRAVRRKRREGVMVALRDDDDLLYCTCWHVSTSRSRDLIGAGPPAPAPGAPLLYGGVLAASPHHLCETLPAIDPSLCSSTRSSLLSLLE